MLIAYSGKAAVRLLTGGAKDAWSTEKILTVGAGCLLTLYSIKLSYEWYQECNEEGEGENGAENENPEGGTYAQVAQNEGQAMAQEGEKPPYDSGRGNKWGCCTPGGTQVPGDVEMAQGKPLSARSREMATAVAVDNPDKPQEELDKADKERQQTLFVIAFIGSVDDLTLFVPMLVGKGFDFVQLMLGAFLATSLIITFCICIGLCKPLADCLSKIPLAVIVIVFATILLLKGFVFDEEDGHKKSS